MPVRQPVRADVRLGGRWTLRQSLKNDAIVVLARSALAACDRLPDRLLLALGRGAGRLAGVAMRVPAGRGARLVRSSSASEVARVCGRHAGENAALCLLLRRPHTRALDWVDVAEDSRAVFRRALAPGRGAVFVSGHVGPFELLPAAVAELGHRPAVVVRESYDPRLDHLVDAHRRTHGIDVIHRGHAGAATRIVRALRAGQPVGFLPDLGGRVPSIAVPFLGRWRPFPIGPQHLAQRLAVPLLLGVLRRTAARRGQPRFDLAVREVDTRGSLESLTARVARELEAAITDAAADFPWMALGEAPAERAPDSAAGGNLSLRP